MGKCTIIFQPSGRRGEVSEGKTILEAAQELGADIESLCGGKRVCGKCRVMIQDGFFEKFGIQSSIDHLSPWTEEEEKFISPEERRKGYRLACAAEIRGDILVFVPEESRAGKQVIRKEARKLEIEIDPAVKHYYVEVSEPTLDDPTGDFERIAEKLRSSESLDGLAIDHRAMLALPDALRRGGWKVTVAVWQGREVVGVFPGKRDKSVGLAVDIGTTTVAGYLCDLDTGEVLATGSMMNPQVKYGEDVMSRITYAMMHPEEGLEKMSADIVECLNDIASAVTGAVSMSSSDIIDMTVVCNTAMHHIFLKINPEYLGLSPFPPAVHHSLDFKARDLGIKIDPSAYVHILPIEAGFVGADNVGVLICEEPYNKEEMSLIVDIGTNGELVLGNREKLVSCSCATGPALEGAQISFGMRAAPGAIERVRIDPETLDVDYKIIGRDEWRSQGDPAQMGAKGICGSGIIDVLAELYRTGIIEKSGAFKKRVETPRYRPEKREFVIAWAEETSIGRDIVISQKDIRQIQLAKGAIYAGAKIMMRKLGVDKLDKVVLAGAFGSYIDAEEALVIGMFPDCPVDKIVSVGNAAGDGARIALLNRAKRDEANRIARQVEYIELTVESDFQQQFIEAMQLPHMKDSFPSLRGIVRDEILNQ